MHRSLPEGFGVNQQNKHCNSAHHITLMTMSVKGSHQFESLFNHLANRLLGVAAASKREIIR
ncbi:hypothetical protein Q7C_269 [Methylophaga frappieri]|uniref:Uncharacterized protein n=1 Tax=Methylophaga frappieri (strain ATCC BAA-2434 / DSM 25690 / JAM7) TaxID=754477 RepID=I1YEV5_METFJ|nr:hypothetical protein Q7C_269 [Methylophaga frappieri]